MANSDDSHLLQVVRHAVGEREWAKARADEAIRWANQECKISVARLARAVGINRSTVYLAIARAEKRKREQP